LPNNFIRHYLDVYLFDVAFRLNFNLYYLSNLLIIHEHYNFNYVKSDLFYADQNMIDMLNNNDFYGYLIYIRNKQYFEKYGKNPYLVEAKKIIDNEVIKAIETQKRDEELIKQEELRIKLANKRKTDLLNNIFENIQRLENTLKEYDNRVFSKK
jgi:hypothetical protein